MQDIIWEVLIVQIISIIALLVMIVLLLRQSKSMRYEKRIDRFALLPLNNEEKSFFDKLSILLWKLVRKTSAFLEKSQVLKKYSEKYERHITYEERKTKSGIDYVSVKFLLGFATVILSIFTMMFQYTKFPVPIILIIFLIGFFLPDLFLTIEFRKKRKRVEEDLLKAIIIMNSAFKSGRNIMQAIEIVKDELEGSISDEFQKIYIDINYGLSLEVVFNRFYERVKLEDVKYITSSLSLLNRTGGNIVKVFSMIEKTFFDKKKLRNELNSMTASSTFVYRLLISLPFVFATIIIVLNPSYFKIMYTTSIGLIVTLLIIILYVLYVLIIKKVMKVKI